MTNERSSDTPPWRPHRSCRPPRPGRLVLLGLALLGPAAAAAGGDEGWLQVHERAGVTVFSRAAAGSPIHEFRAVAEMDLPAPALLATVADIESYPGRMPPTLVARRIRGGGESTWYYMEINPSMIARRFYCLHVVQSRLPGGALRSEWSVDNSVCPEHQPGMVRIEHNSGSWTLTPLSDSRTRVTFQTHSDPGGSIPAWMVNQFTARTLPETVESLRAMALRGRVARK